MNLTLLIITIGLCFGFRTLLKSLKKEKQKIIVKAIIYGIFVLCFSFRLFQSEQFERVKAIFNPSLYENNDNMYDSYAMYVIVFAIRTLTQGVVVSLIVSTWFKNDLGKRINGYVAPIIYLLNICFFQYTLKAIVSETSTFYSADALCYGFECMSAILLSFIARKEIHKTKKKFKTGVNTVLLLLGCCYCGSYNSFLSNLIGDCLPIVQQFNFGHLLIAIYPIVLFIILFMILRKKNDYNRWYGMMLLTSGLCIRHWYLYQTDITVLPLALCHLGCCLLPIGMAIKNKNILYFCQTNSVIGAIFALAIPSACYGSSIATVCGTHFVSNHVLLLVLCVLPSCLNLIPSLKFKDLKNVFIMNIIYYVVVVIASILLPDVSYFFFNNTELIENASFIINLMPVRNNYIIEFTIFNINAKVYYLYWIVMFVFLNLMTIGGFGFYKLECLVASLFTKKKHKKA